MGENIPHKGTQVNEILIGLYTLEQCKDTVGRGRVPIFMADSGQIKEKSCRYYKTRTYKNSRKNSMT